MIGKALQPFEAIPCNDDKLTYGSIITVQTGPQEAITALTNYGIEELTVMNRDARTSTRTWHEFLDDFVNDAVPPSSTANPLSN